MSEPSTSRKALRRAICRAARLDFYRRYDDGYVLLTGTPTTTALPSTALAQGTTDHWKNGWAYLPGLEEARRITAFTPSTDLLTVEYAFGDTPAAGAELEIIELWSPATIHQAINRAIEIASRLFPITTRSDDFYLPENGIIDLSNMTPPVRHIHRVMVNPNVDFIPFVAETASKDVANKVLAETVDLPGSTTGLYNGWRLRKPFDGSIFDLEITVSSYNATTGAYALTAPGTTQTVAPVDGDTLYVVSPEQTPRRNYYDLLYLRPDAPEWPNTLTVETFPAELVNHQVVLDYTTLPVALTAETDTTIIPAEYIIRRALAILHEDLAHDNRSDVQRHQQLSQYYHEQADQFMTAFHTQRPVTPQSFSVNATYTTGNVSDPLNWEGN